MEAFRITVVVEVEISGHDLLNQVAKNSLNASAFSSSELQVVLPSATELIEASCLFKT